jgi:hypothetical protein
MFKNRSFNLFKIDLALYNPDLIWLGKSLINFGAVRVKVLIQDEWGMEFLKGSRLFNCFPVVD